MSKIQIKIVILIICYYIYSIANVYAASVTRLIYLQSPIGPITYSQRLYVCNSCVNLSDAENFVLGYVKLNNLIGTHSVEVANTNSSSTWFILYEYYPFDYSSPIVDEAEPGTTADGEVLKTVDLGGIPPIVIHIGTDSAYPNLTTLSVWNQGNNINDIWSLLDTYWGTKEMVLYSLQQDANMLFPSQGTGIDNLAQVEQFIYSDLSIHFGGCPSKGTIVFADGSVGQFCFTNWAKNIVTFVKGSGRTASGAFYSINGDSMNGSNYVTPYSGGEGYFLQLTSDSYIVCYDYYSNGNFIGTTCPHSP